MNQQKFPLGFLQTTPGVLKLLEEHSASPDMIASYLSRHQSGDWGGVVPEDAEANERALERGGRIFSSYRMFGKKIWIITEWDRSLTTVLLPSEY